MMNGQVAAGRAQGWQLSDEPIERIKALLLSDEYDFLGLDDHKAAVMAIRLKLRSGAVIYLPEVHRERFTGRWVLDGGRLRDHFISWKVRPAEVPELVCYRSFIKEYGEEIEHEIEVNEYGRGRKTTEDSARGGNTKRELDIRPRVGADIGL